jgi:hypothetical protein
MVLRVSGSNALRIVVLESWSPEEPAAEVNSIFWPEPDLRAIATKDIPGPQKADHLG